MANAGPENAAPADATSTMSSHAVVMAKRSVRIVHSCTVRRTAGDLYDFWRDVINFHGVVPYPVSITPISTTESRWVVSAPSGINTVEWYAVIITDQPPETIAWRSRDGAQIPNAGSVHFRPAPGDEGTEVTVELRYEPPAGRAGAWIAKLTGKEPGQQLAATLRRFKALMETGEIPTTSGQPAGSPQRERERTAS